MTSNTDRSLTLDGANKIFSVENIEIVRHELGYAASWNGQEFIAKTLTKLCRNLLKTIAAANYTH